VSLGDHSTQRVGAMERPPQQVLAAERPEALAQVVAESVAAEWVATAEATAARLAAVATERAASEVAAAARHSEEPAHQAERVVRSRYGRLSKEPRCRAQRARMGKELFEASSFCMTL
jgi:hypothetical protein